MGVIQDTIIKEHTIKINTLEEICTNNISNGKISSHFLLKYPLLFINNIEFVSIDNMYSIHVFLSVYDDKFYIKPESDKHFLYLSIKNEKDFYNKMRYFIEKDNVLHILKH